MRDKVLLNVRLAATQRSYEFLVPVAITVGEAAGLICRMLHTREPVLFATCRDASLMWLEGPCMSAVADPSCTVASFVERDLISDGIRMALV